MRGEEFTITLPPTAQGVRAACVTALAEGHEFVYLTGGAGSGDQLQEFPVSVRVNQTEFDEPGLIAMGN